jgi:hypothetical protein
MDTEMQLDGYLWTQRKRETGVESEEAVVAGCMDTERAGGEV